MKKLDGSEEAQDLIDEYDLNIVVLITVDREGALSFVSKKRKDWESPAAGSLINRLTHAVWPGGAAAGAANKLPC